MDASEPQPLDQQTRELCAKADYRTAATLILQELGTAVVRVLHARFQDDTKTSEVFSQFAEDLWVGLPAFGFRCSVRAWVFTLARNAGNRYLDRDLRKQRVGVPLSEAPELAAQLDDVRRTTLAHLRTTNRDRVSELRRTLSDEEQLILTLRIDRNMDWREIAVVMMGEPEADAVRIGTEAARLRKRFQLVKDKLRKLVAKPSP